ncbi:MAG: hypothetical protein JWL65_4457 [Gammaproteobacteria bacterium]|nr:hypothetical protein [Gammaproteobacteria bacterium]
MDTRKLVETPNASEEVKNADGARRADSVKLVEMGQVSVETKGVARGLELGFTPRS